MEELQSTEILDREILEDARKKVQRILKSTDDAIKAKSADWEKNLKASLGELEKKYEQQGKFFTEEVMARLPMDKRRIKAKKIEEMLHSAVAGWYEGLGRERVLELVKNGLAKRVAASEKSALAGEMSAQIHKLERKEAEGILQKVFPGKPCAIKEIQSVSPYPEIILETKEARIYASIGKTVELFLDEKRAELVDCLLGNTEIAGEES
ncbi:MAG: hypothetical protein LBI06_04595 [Treponema sp.]|jgi:hypothetical protein|nr:hypothetical protein [Treponema sp.]